MIVEWLQFWINPSDRALFLEQDAKIWTPILKSQSGFVRKEYWQPPTPEELAIVVHWQSQEQWKAIPLAMLQATEAKFAQAVGENNYRMLDCREFPVFTPEL